MAEVEQWGAIDPTYTQLRRALTKDPAWRYGPLRVHQVAKSVHDGLSRNGSIIGTRYADVGAGCQHPLGTSAVLYLNGVSFAASLDVQETDTRRAAEALYDLLVDCLVDPDMWHWSEIDRDRFLGNIRRFDLRALQNGDLDKGTAAIPFVHHVRDLADLPFADGTIDVMSSRAVFEHFLDYRSVLERLYRLMSSGGRGYHHIDLTDHRRYVNPADFDSWSFLSEPEGWTDNLCNRLRLREFSREFEATGFEVEIVEEYRNPLPPGLRPRLSERFAAMPDEELEVTAFDCVLTKPF